VPHAGSLIIEISGSAVRPQYLRDDNLDIPFPNHWDLFGGQLEGNENPEQALVREVKEEVGVELEQWEFFGFITALKVTLIRILSIFIGHKLTDPLRSLR
jgi:8-oxo-dGTP pyrophosphatase MutT (NUDIX family)